MNEKAKTLAFVAAAAAVVLLAFVTRSSSPVATPDDLRGQLLYPEFKPLDVTSLELVEFNDETGEVKFFQVAQGDYKGKTRWVIPSHDDYPADAKTQVADAAAALMGLKVLEVVTDNQGERQEYGVVDPDPKTLKIGATGVGEKVIMKNADGKELLALVIGKEVPDRPGLRYVCKVGQDPIYVVEIKTDKLSMNFENWIERNLLQINSFDIDQLWVRDYSVDELNGTLNQRGEMKIEYNDTADPRWKLIDDRQFVIVGKKGQWRPVKMADDEELNTAKLDELKNALDDLKIVDVNRKPAGLSADLKTATDFATHSDGVESLARKGFFVAKLGKQVGLFSNEGEIRVVMKDGVEYVLRFGEIAAGSGPAKKDKKEGASGLNRYLFVMAEFNPNVIPKPEIEPLPEVKKDAEKESVEDKAEEKKPDESAAEKADEKKPDPQAERDRIEKDNERKQDEYEQKVADAKKHVAELNARFADWYYIISDKVYQKIHLNRDEIVKKKEKPGEDEPSEDGPAGTTTVPPMPAEMLEKLKAQKKAEEK